MKEWCNRMLIGMRGSSCLELLDWGLWCVSKKERESRIYPCKRQWSRRVLVLFPSITVFSFWNVSNVFHSLRRKKSNTQQSPVTLDLRFSKTQWGTSHDYRDVRDCLPKSSFPKMFSIHNKPLAGPPLAAVWNHVKERLRKASFSRRLVWTTGLMTDIKLRFRFLQYIVDGAMVTK